MVASTCRRMRGTLISITLAGLLGCSSRSCLSDLWAPDPRTTCGLGRTPAPRAVGNGMTKPLKPPRLAVIHLAELTGSVVGTNPERPGQLLSLTAEQLKQWPLRETNGNVRIVSPTWGPEIESAARLHLRLKPGGATTVRIVPLTTADDSDDMQRRLRETVIALERDALPGASVELEVDLTTLIHHGWADAAREERLRALEITLPGARPKEVVLEDFRLESEDAKYALAAEPSTLERHNLLRPGWYVRAGSRVDFTVETPSEGSHELRLWVAGTHVQTKATVTTGAAPHEARFDSEGDDAWKPLRIPLEPKGAGRFRLSFSADGQGVALFGDPTIVRTDEQETPPDVLLYLVDTLVAERLGAWGSELPDVSPCMDRLAREGMTFGRAKSAAPWTKPSVPTILTGVFPPVHRVGATSYTDRLPPSVPTLQARFREAGFRTGSFVSNPLGSTLSGLEHGFGAAYPPAYWDGRVGAMGVPTALQLQDAFLAWLDEQPDRPFFAFIHSLDVHEYPRPMFAQGQEGYQPYDNAIRQQDRSIDALLLALEQRGRDRNLLLVLLSDHGEAFGDHGLESHGFSLYESQLHVPLIFWSRSILPRATINDVVSLADVAPTLLELTGLPALPDAQGHSLLPYATGNGKRTAEDVPATRIRYVWAPNQPEWTALTSPDLQKAIVLDNGQQLAFDLSSDPCETTNMAPRAADLLARARRWRKEQDAKAKAFQQRYGTGGSVGLNASDSARLRALGYAE